MAFAPSAFSSSFLGHRPATQRAVCVQSAGPRMMAEGDKKGFGSFFENLNPFGRSKETAFMKPQPGDPGYVEPPVDKSAPSSTPAAPAAPKKGAKLPVKTGITAFDSAARGLELLREDLFKNAPVAAGVGRQDETGYIKPQPGEPGYKPQAYEVTYVSDLGISPFADDPNYVDEVGAWRR